MSDFDRGKFVVGMGPTPAQVFMCGRNPGIQESRIALPFVGQAGNELSMYMLRSDLQRSDCYVTNYFKWYTLDDDPPTAENYAAHYPILCRELAIVQPQIVVCFGADVTENLFAKCGLPYLDMERLHGIPFTATLDIQPGLSNDCDQELPEDEAGVDWLLNLMATAPETCEPLELTLFPCLHPASGIHAPSKMSTIYTDFLALAALLRGELPIRTVPTTQPLKDAARTFPALRNGAVRSVLETESQVKAIFQTDSLVMGLDTEGNAARPWGLTASFDGKVGYCIRSHSKEALAAFIHCLAEFTAKGGIVIVHNMLWDIEVLAKMGVILPETGCLDSMIGLYLLGREPQGLKASAYRNLGITMSSYEDVVAPYERAYSLSYLEAAASIDWDECKLCGKEAAALTTHPKNGTPPEYLRKDGQPRVKFADKVEICDGGLADHVDEMEVYLDKNGEAKFRRQQPIGRRIQRALKDFSEPAPPIDLTEAEIGATLEVEVPAL